jgi:hypothetical protein
VDLHAVEGLRGTYVASQLATARSAGKVELEEVRSLISVDGGGEWSPISPPSFDHDGNPIYCHIKTQVSQRSTWATLGVIRSTRAN